MRGKRRWLWWIGVPFALFVAFTLAIVISGWRSFGQAASGARLARMQASPQWSNGIFVNPQPMKMDNLGSLLAFTRVSPAVSPSGPVPVISGDGSAFRTPPATGLRVTWFGHSSQLLELDGHRILTDPAFGDRASPISWLGPHRWYPPPVALADLPPVDVVLISHDHPDHLNREAIEGLRSSNAVFFVPLGVGAHLEYWGIPPARIVELDWWEHAKVGGLDIVCTPVRHASGRQVFDQMANLWASWVVIGPRHRAWYSGDTGLFPALRDIGERFGPFDLTMIESGQYDRTWPDWHLGPEQAVRAHQMVRGKVLLPIHWGLWALASHGWTEPAERVFVAAQKASVRFALPKPGESLEPEALPPLSRWWPDEPWETAAAAPVVSTGVD